MLAHNQKIQKLVGGGALERLWLGTISRAQIFLLSRHKDRETVRLVRQVRRQRTSLLTAYEAWMVYSLGKAYHHLPGELAEVGVFQGASAKLLTAQPGDSCRSSVPPGFS